MGPVFFDAGATLSLEYNDNINSSANNPSWDFIISPGIYLNGEWEISNLNTFRFGLGASYRKYTNNTELDSSENFLNLTPDTELAFRFFVGDVSFEVFDQLTYSIDATSAFGIDQNGAVIENVSDYGRFRNNIGIQADWDLNDVKLFARFTRLDGIPTDSEFDFARFTEYRLSGGPRFILAPNLTVGITGSITDTSYEEGFNNDSIRYFLGPDATWQVSSLLTLQGSVGYTLSDIDVGGTNGDTSESEGLFGRIEATHRASRFYSHGLSFSRSITNGFISNTNTVDEISYKGEWKAYKRLTLNGRITWESGDESGGLAPEDYDRIIFSLGTSLTLAQRLSAELDYEYSTKDSSIASRSFDRNRLTLLLRYDF